MLRNFTVRVLCFVLVGMISGSALAADPVYREKNEYPVLDEMTAERDSLQAFRDSVRSEVDALYAEQAKARKDTARSLRVDWSQIETPTGPDQFDQLWHNPPVPQYYTGTCWVFCSTSYIESEAHRISDVDVKLSEMWIVYWEYVEKARSFLQEFGHTPVDQGGQDSGTLEILRQYGAVPQEAYAGVLDSRGRHDHNLLIKELKGYLKWVLESGTWDEDQNMAYVRSILDKHMGPVPAEFEWEGKTYTPRAFLTDVLKLDMNQFRSVVSRMDEPFNSEVLLDVHDNWRRKDNYLNLPLDDFYAVIKNAITDGYTVSVGGDNSEAGMDGKFDVAIVPEWDIPSDYINQGSREFRIANGTTGDDHGVHVVGYLELDGRDWFLIKDSNRSSRLGEHKGYYFWDGDYIKLKMLSFTIHEDRLKEYLN
ncbi:MAG: peptidase C1 [Candidatus Krumholzibacteria bacterium]|nr:peptidase C1 [Candidatus Krumholzibacteria bacterium]